MEKIIKSRLGLNEVTVQNSNYAITEVDLYVDGELVTGYRCDGLIISSPIGSTAHSLRQADRSCKTTSKRLLFAR